MPTMSIHSVKKFAPLIGLFLTITLTVPATTPGSERTGSLTTIGKMHELRASHTATLLPNGKVLIAGGFKKERTYDQVYFNSAELYDPETKTFTPTGSLNVARCGHTATLLQNGSVLIAGGDNDQPLASAEIYNPPTGIFTLIGEMAVPRQGHTATLLKNGNVLIAGGATDEKHNTELFNITTQRFEPTGSLKSNRLGHTATLLPNGNVLVCGGTNGERRDHKVYATAEIYDCVKGTFSSTGSMSMVRYKHAALLLPDRNVLIAGGSNERDWQGQYNTAEIYNTKSGVFLRTQDMEGKRFKLPNGVTLLNDGTTLVSGGGKKVETYDLTTRAFTTVAQFEEPHFYQTATLLPNGDVLIAGGYNTQPQSTDQAWVYRK